MMHEPCSRCYACTIDITGKYRNSHKMAIAFGIYEDVVEFIEALPAGTTFSRIGVWRDMGRGYQEYTLVMHVIRDMKMHGLIKCVKLTSHGKCRGYQVIS